MHTITKTIKTDCQLRARGSVHLVQKQKVYFPAVNRPFVYIQAKVQKSVKHQNLAESTADMFPDYQSCFILKIIICYQGKEEKLQIQVFAGKK